MQRRQCGPYTPVASTPATTFDWSRGTVAGISPTGNTGTGNITKALTNTQDTSITVVYELALTDSGCTSLHDVFVTVSPQPQITSITTESASSICAGTQYHEFRRRRFCASRCSIYLERLLTRRSSLQAAATGLASVNFPDTGTAYIVLTITVPGEHCVINDTAVVTVDPFIIYSGWYFVLTTTSLFTRIIRSILTSGVMMMATLLILRMIASA